MKRQGLIPRASSYPVSVDGASSTALSANRLCANAELTALHDNLRGALAMQAMNHISALSAAEARCNQIAPSGKNEYRQIVRAYAYGAISELLGGE